MHIILKLIQKFLILLNDPGENANRIYLYTIYNLLVETFKLIYFQPNTCIRKNIPSSRSDYLYNNALGKLIELYAQSIQFTYKFSICF